MCDDGEWYFTAATFLFSANYTNMKKHEDFIELIPLLN